MEALRLVVLLLLAVVAHVSGAGGSPLSSGDRDGETWTVENWQVRDAGGSTGVRDAPS